jgi:hypothetical protein
MPLLEEKELRQARCFDKEVTMLEELNREFQSLKTRIQDIRSYL